MRAGLVLHLRLHPWLLLGAARRHVCSLAMYGLRVMLVVCMRAVDFLAVSSFRAATVLCNSTEFEG
jgi:hypothetical protein